MPMANTQLEAALKASIQRFVTAVSNQDALNSLKLDGKTLAEVTQLILAGTAANADKFNGMTYEQVLASITGEGSVLAGLQDQLDAFIARRDNPHEVTKEQVGLGSVENYAVATAEEAAAGATDKYLTPALVKQLIQTGIEALVGSAPDALDTLQELAAALNNDPDIISKLQTMIAGKETTTGAQEKADAALADGKAYVDAKAASTLEEATAFNDEAMQVITDMCNTLAAQYEMPVAQ